MPDDSNHVNTQLWQWCHWRRYSNGKFSERVLPKCLHARAKCYHHQLCLLQVQRPDLATRHLVTFYCWTDSKVSIKPWSFCNFFQAPKYFKMIQFEKSCMRRRKQARKISDWSDLFCFHDLTPPFTFFHTVSQLPRQQSISAGSHPC